MQCDKARESDKEGLLAGPGDASVEVRGRESVEIVGVLSVATCDGGIYTTTTCADVASQSEDAGTCELGGVVPEFAEGAWLGQVVAWHFSVGQYQRCGSATKK